MAIPNRDRVGKALDLLKTGLVPFVERELKAQYQQQWLLEVQQAVGPSQTSLFGRSSEPPWDATSLLAVLWNRWNDVFSKTLGRTERSIVQELRDVRNNWAHQQTFSSDDADRALDSVERLLTAVSAPEADEVRKLKLELRRTIFDEQARTERRRTARETIDAAATGNLKPWRDVITPHPDVASGRYQQAEFAADLWQVYRNDGGPEYKDPVEFFRRTFLTESLKQLLSLAVRKLAESDGDPVVQLQTNFGGGKTHSMLALFHLFSGVEPSSLPGVEEVMQATAVQSLPTVRRVVLVGNKISPGNPVTKPDGTVVRTLWGELAYQLGGAEAYERIRHDDERATSPGDALRELFVEYGPCLVLVDEWVAYARQLHDQGDLPAGSFETQFSFAQVLTESARDAKNCLLVVSLPASDSSASPHTQSNDAEVGGERGHASLVRLQNVVGRLEWSWRPATAEEGFEIVRRRLFEPLSGDAFTHRDVVARAYGEFYRRERAEFPPECAEPDYEKRIKAAYPIHPEIFDRLYTDWSTLVKFQRTRGVLRLMAAVIHSLWENGDRNPLIQPANVPIDDPRVSFEVNRYLSDNWMPIIEKDIDGPGSLPRRMDAEVPNLGRLHACRRVARTIFLGSAPTATVANRGIEDRRIKLGAVMPEESTGVFGDALRRLAGAATYLYSDGPRFWYGTQPTVTKVAEDRAELLKGDTDKVVVEIERRIRADVNGAKGEFERVHPVPGSGVDVSDDAEARLVVLPSTSAFTRGATNPAEEGAARILESRGTQPRLYRNALVFLAADQVRLQDLDEAVRRFLAWQSIVNEKVQLDLSPYQVRQAEDQLRGADSTVNARLPETWQWLLVPTQETPQSPIAWEATRLTGQEPLAVRASKRLVRDERMVGKLASTLLRMEMDRVPLWRGDRVEVRQLMDDFGRYPYLTRLRDSGVLAAAICDGLALTSWERESFAYADGYDEAAGRYRGLVVARHVNVGVNDPGMLVRPEIASAQLIEEAAAAAEASGSAETAGGAAVVGGAGDEQGGSPPSTPGVPAAPPRPKRYHGSVELDSSRVGFSASKIGEEVVAHLDGLVGSIVTVTLEIDARVPDGVPENVVRIVLENGRTLRFTSQEFERD